MSRNINVNPGNYKVAGRERQGEDIIHREQKQTYATQRSGGMSNDIPPWEATRHSFVSAQPPDEPRAKTARKAGSKRRAAQKKGSTARKPGRKVTRAMAPARASGAAGRRRAASRPAARQRRVKRSTRRR
jgi:hypothetical protein